MDRRCFAVAYSNGASQGRAFADINASVAVSGRSRVAVANDHHAQWLPAHWLRCRQCCSNLASTRLIGSTRSVRVFAYAQPADLRRSYDGLYAIATHEMEHDVLAGDLFLFVNKRRNRAKVLLFDGTGMCIYMKRMDKGRFAAPWRRSTVQFEMTTSELSLFLEGALLLESISLSPKRITQEDLAVGLRI